MRSKVVKIPYEENGSISYVSYRRLSARLPGFLEKYPPDQFRLEFITTDLLSTQTGYLELLKATIVAGLRPTDIGLSLEAVVNTFVSKATLYGPNDVVIRTASARSVVATYKDHEKLETAAHQRILASLGFGGELFDEDEDRDIADQGLAAAAATQGQMNSDTGGTEAIPLELPDGATNEDEGEASLKLARTESVSPPENRSDTTDPRGRQSGAAPAAKPPKRPKSRATPKAPDDRQATEAMRRQIASMAKRLGEQPRKVEWEAEAIAEMQRLGELERQRRRQSAD